MVTAPLLPARKYRLRWQADGSQFSSPHDPGLAFRLVGKADNDVIAQCGPLLVNGDSGSCDFESLPDLGKVRVALFYTRAPGTTRIRGALRLVKVWLEFAS